MPVNGLKSDVSTYTAHYPELSFTIFEDGMTRFSHWLEQYTTTILYQIDNRDSRFNEEYASIWLAASFAGIIIAI